MRREDKR